MAEPGAGVLPEAYRPAASPDVPDGQSCANCVFFETQDEGEGWCNWWEAPVEADAYCDAWSDDPAAMTEIVEEGLEEVDEVPMNVNKRASFETVDEDESRYMDQAADKTAGGPKWEGVIAVEDQMTGDSRMFSPGAMRWDTLPVPLRWVKEDTGEHFGAVVVGRVDEVWRDGNVIYGRGIFDEGSEEGKEAIRQVTAGFTQGVSVDLDDVSFEIRVRGEVADPMADPATEDQPAEPTDPNTVMNFTPDEEVMVTTDARLRALTIVATPAFAEARIQMTGDMTPAAEPTEDEVPDELIAAAAPTLPPSGWFIDPKLDGPTPLTITADGRVYGHLAVWGTCHTGFVGECVEPPASATNYAYFRTGAVRTSDKETVATGRLTVDTTHAGRRLGAADTSAHYEHTGLAVADVAAGEDVHGIWVAGALRPNVTDEQVRALQASPLSGDWRRIGGNLELVAALAVNSPGFPVPRVLVAGGKVQTLQASGVLTAEETADAKTEEAEQTTQLDFDSLVKRLIDREVRLMERERKQAAAAKTRVAASLARARYSMATGKYHGDHDQSDHAGGGGSGTEGAQSAREDANNLMREIDERRDEVSQAADSMKDSQAPDPDLLQRDLDDADDLATDAEQSAWAAEQAYAEGDEARGDRNLQASKGFADDASALIDKVTAELDRHSERQSGMAVRRVKRRFKSEMRRAKYHGDHEQSSHAWGGGPGGAENRAGQAEQEAERVRDAIETAMDEGLIDEASYDQLMADLEDAESLVEEAVSDAEDAQDIMDDLESGEQLPGDERAGEAAELVDMAHKNLAEAEEFLQSAESELDAAIAEASAPGGMPEGIESTIELLDRADSTAFMPDGQTEESMAALADAARDQGSNAEPAERAALAQQEAQAAQAEIGELAEKADEALNSGNLTKNEAENLAMSVQELGAAQDAARMANDLVDVELSPGEVWDSPRDRENFENGIRDQLEGFEDAKAEINAAFEKATGGG